MATNAGSALMACTLAQDPDVSGCEPDMLACMSDTACIAIAQGVSFLEGADEAAQQLVYDTGWYVKHGGRPAHVE